MGVIAILALLACAGFLVAYLAATRSEPSGSRQAPEADASRPESAGPPLEALDRIGGGLAMARRAMYAVAAVALLAGAMYTARVATPGNGLALVSLLLFVFSLGAFVAAFAAGRGRARISAPEGAWQPNVSVTFRTEQPEVFSLDNDLYRRARELRAAGRDLDAICREVNPAYAGWDPFKQHAFRSVLEAALAHRPGPG